MDESPASFYDFWSTNYPKSVPLGHFLREDYSQRWFRIHSLPESERYAENEEEWKILLYRQNAVITDILGAGEKFYLVTGRFFYLDSSISEIGQEYNEFEFFKNRNLCESDAINLVDRYPEQEETGIHFIPASVKETWSPGAFDDLLKLIANDKTRAIFVGIQRKVILAPYDGGVDCIVENPGQVKYYKRKYKNWLSRLKSGL